MFVVMRFFIDWNVVYKFTKTGYGGKLMQENFFLKSHAHILNFLELVLHHIYSLNLLLFETKVKRVLF